MRYYCFFFNDTATTEIYTLSLHDALPIFGGLSGSQERPRLPRVRLSGGAMTDSSRSSGVRFSAPRNRGVPGDRKSTRLNSSHANISYAVFCLKKKKNTDK